MSTDYLVIGAGASAMSFVDVILEDTDATVTIVDRRDAPGGHWNDGYPFLRLHQPSDAYGVPSRPLGRGKIDQTGYNRGLYELASGTDVAAYFHAVMSEHFLPSGRVTYCPMSDYTGNGGYVSLLSGERHYVDIAKSLVDGTLINTSIPLTHRRQFGVGEGVMCVPPNDLPRIAPNHKHFTVLGAGKTGLDTVLWLLANGAPPDTISWVIPRDAWMINRISVQPGLDFFESVAGIMAAQYAAQMTATTLTELCQGMEAAGRWIRLDPNVWPTVQHASSVTPIELEELRRVRNVIRLGRVKHIEPGKMVLERGTRPTASDTLYVDCTASALAKNVNDSTPVFSPGRISLQMIRQFQPTFSAALIGRIEATIEDDAEKQRLTTPTPMTDTVEDWLRIQPQAMINEREWTKDKALRAWLSQCRLNCIPNTWQHVPKSDVTKQELLKRVRDTSGPALENLQRLAQTLSNPR